MYINIYCVNKLMKNLIFNVLVKFEHQIDESVVYNSVTSLCNYEYSNYYYCLPGQFLLIILSSTFRIIHEKNKLTVIYF